MREDACFMEEWLFGCDEEGMGWLGADYLGEGGLMLDEGYGPGGWNIGTERCVRWLGRGESNVGRQDYWGISTVLCQMPQLFYQ